MTRLDAINSKNVEKLTASVGEGLRLTVELEKMKKEVIKAQLLILGDKSKQIKSDKATNAYYSGLRKEKEEAVGKMNEMRQ